MEVLEQKRVGDYDAAVLAFRKGDGDSPERGAEELAKWLAKHGYEAPPAIEPWLAKYVQDGWCVTAFKIASPEAKNGVPNTRPMPNPMHGNDVQRSPSACRSRPRSRSTRTASRAVEVNTQTGARSLRVFFAAGAATRASSAPVRSRGQEDRVGEAGGRRRPGRPCSSTRS